MITSWPLLFALALCFLAPAGMVAATHIYFWRKWQPEPTASDLDAATWGGSRIGTIHALVLALMFSSSMSEYRELEESLEVEALAFERLHRTLGALESETANGIQSTVLKYANSVVDVEWPMLRQHGTTLTGLDTMLVELRFQIFDMAPREVSASITASMISDLNKLEMARGQRIYDVYQPVPLAFWIIIVLSLVFSVQRFFVYRPTRNTTTILASFAGINGTILCAIVYFSHPFSIMDEPTAFNLALERSLQDNGRGQ